MNAIAELAALPAHLDAWIAALHPHLAGVDSVQLLCVAVVSLLGVRAITGGR